MTVVRLTGLDSVSVLMGDATAASEVKWLLSMSWLGVAVGLDAVMSDDAADAEKVVSLGHSEVSMVIVEAVATMEMVSYYLWT